MNLGCWCPRWEYFKKEGGSFSVDCFWEKHRKMAFWFGDFSKSYLGQFSSVQSLSRVWLSATPWTAPHQAAHHQLPVSTQTHVHRVGDAIQPVHPLLSPSPPALNLSQHQGLSNESALRIRWPKYWSFSFNTSPSNEHPWPISFRMDWLDVLAVQGTLKSLLQHHSSKASILHAQLSL